MADYLGFDPAIIDKRQVYRLLTGSVVPRPIGWASTVGPTGVTKQPVWKEMVDSANGFPEEDSEFSKTGLTPIPCVKIKPPRVKEVPIHFECKLERVLELGPNRHPLVIGEVIYMHVDPACMTGKYIDMRKLDPIGRLNGFFYATLGEIFEREFVDGQAR